MTDGVHEVGCVRRRCWLLAPWMISVVVHLSLVLCLAVWVYAPGGAAKGIAFVGSVSEPASVSVAVESQTLVPNEVEEYSDTQTTSEWIPSFELDKEMDFRKVVTDANFISAITSQAASTPIPQTRSASNRSGVEFFGAYAEGQRFVFVIDSSTSMTGKRWVYACGKLMDSLRNLRPDQEFFIISFDLRPSFLFSRRPNEISFYRNSENVLGKVQRWLKNKQLGRGTRPAQAMMHALAMKPDAIFLLSDGELQDDTAFQLLKLNQSTLQHTQIPVHTVHLFSVEGRGTLQTIAQSNGGSFTPVIGW